MSSVSFTEALAFVLRYEGGYVNHPKDPGGPTMRGITQRTLARYRGREVSVAEVKALTVEEAGAIYRTNYWDEVKGDVLPIGVDLAVFDFAVNSGPGRAIRLLQAVLRVKQDGVLGPVTLAAVKKFSATFLIRALCDLRLDFKRRLPGWRSFGRGWSARIKALERECLRLRDKAPSEKISPAESLSV
jgi:lysozyme family protein